jgi:hypothetical protein
VPAEVLIVPQRTRLAGRICACLRRVFRRRRNFAISAPRLRLAFAPPAIRSNQNG